MRGVAWFTFRVKKCKNIQREVIRRQNDSPQRCHGYNGVPEGGRDAGELAGRGAFLSVEHDCGKDDDGHGEGEEEEAELGCAALQRVAKDPETLGVAGEFKDPEDAEHP